MNENTYVGNLTRDPKIHASTKNGRIVTTFDLAVNHRRYDQEAGEWVDQEPVFWRVVSYGPLAENAGESLRRGVEVVVIGRVVDDSYEQDGERRRRVAIEAEVIAPSLRWAIARPVKVDRRPGTEDQADEQAAG